MVTNNGDANTLSGQGTPNPKLVIPNKNLLNPAELSMALAIEQWCNNLVAPETGNAGITKITSTGGTVMVTAPTGPTTEIEVSNPLTLTSPDTLSTTTDQSGNGFAFVDAYSHGLDVYIAASSTEGMAYITMNNGIGYGLFMIGQGSPQGVVPTNAQYSIYLDAVAGTIWQNSAGSSSAWVQVGAPGYLGITTGAPSTTPPHGSFMSDTGGSFWVYNGAWVNVT